MSHRPRTFANATDYMLTSLARGITAADLNADGKPELAIGYYDGLSILLNLGDGTFAPRVDYQSDGWTNDSPDLAVVGDGRLNVFLNTGDGTLSPQNEYRVGFEALTISAADFDGDGNVDLATANRGDNAIGVLVNNGDGTFAAQLEFGAGRYTRGAAAIDIDGDGKPDLLSTNGDSTIYVIPNLTPPRVLDASFALSDGQGQLRFTFNWDVSASLSRKSLELTSLSSKKKIHAKAYAYDRSTNTATFTLHRSLRSGQYLATLPAAAVRDATGTPMSSDFRFNFEIPGRIVDQIIKYRDPIISESLVLLLDL